MKARNHNSLFYGFFPLNISCLFIVFPSNIIFCQFLHRLIFLVKFIIFVTLVFVPQNMVFQAEQRIKVQIMTQLGSDQIFRLLSDDDQNVVLKTLGLLRNLLFNKLHIDHIMSLHGTQIMQAVVLILESDNAPEVKEQALCILANIADGDTAKNFIMSNEDVLKKITNYMLHHNNKLGIAAVLCVQNLIRVEDDGATERQTKLREMGVYKILQQLLTTTDVALFEK